MKISLEDPLSLDSYLEDGFPISLDLFELDYISNSQGKSNSITLKPAMYEIFDEFISQKVWRDQWNHQSLYVTKAQVSKCLSFSGPYISFSHKHRRIFFGRRECFAATLDSCIISTLSTYIAITHINTQHG